MTPDESIRGFLDKYAPEIREQVAEARAHLAEQFPRGYVLVYDNYNALVFAYSASERASGVVLSVAAYPKWVTLFFAHGASFADPSGVLQGTGTKFRSIRLQPMSRLYEPATQALITEAKAQFHEALAAAPLLSTVVKSVSAKQRERKPQAKVSSSSKPSAKRPRSVA